MRLIRGAPGSGKTALVFREFKQALADARTNGDPNTLRIIVPTATLVRHFQHELARDGIVFSPSCVVSLTRFAQERAPDIKPVPDTLLRVIVADSLRHMNLPEFSGVANTEGMVSTIIDTITLFENANCTPQKLAKIRSLPSQAKAFQRLWQAVGQAILNSGFQTRAALIRAASAATLRAPLRIWMDGFLAFSPLESELLKALAKTCDLTLTLFDSPATDDVRKLALAMGAIDQLLPGPARKPVTAILEARSLERETDEIARRILALQNAGTPFRRIGVALRDTAAYLPLLRTTFDRFGIQARFYFSTALRQHPVAILLNGMISGALTGYDFETLLPALRAHPHWGKNPHFDRFDFDVRAAMPGSGAPDLLAICGNEWLRNEITQALEPSQWLTLTCTPLQWQTRLEHFATHLYRPGRIDDPHDHSAIAVARSHVAGLQSWLAAIDSIAAFWNDPETPIALEEFWRIASTAINGSVLSPRDDRSEVVHVMSVYEARQWDVAALFVCGMVDRDFPQRSPANLLFPDAGLAPLIKAGIHLRSAADLEEDEDGLFKSLQTRARESLVFSYPLHDKSGKGAQRSRFLETAAIVESAVPCRPEPRTELPSPAFAGYVRDPALLAEMARLHQSISLTALESLAQCRFKFFGARTLALKTAPETPADRLNPRVTGSILHKALEVWLADRTRSFVDVYEETFDDTCRRDHIPPGYRLEVDRINFRKIAQRVSATEQWTSETPLLEVELAMNFPGGITVKCRVDRIDTFGNECVIIDYKSSKTENVAKLVESATALQGPLYALAARESLNLDPVAMVYWAVRDDKRYGWGAIPGLTGDGSTFKEMPLNWATEARTRTVARLTDFLSGTVTAQPVDKESCRWCDFKTACRVEQQALVMIESAHGA